MKQFFCKKGFALALRACTLFGGYMHRRLLSKHTSDPSRRSARAWETKGGPMSRHCRRAGLRAVLRRAGAGAASGLRRDRSLHLQLHRRLRHDRDGRQRLHGRGCLLRAVLQSLHRHLSGKQEKRQPDDRYRPQLQCHPPAWRVEGGDPVLDEGQIRLPCVLSAHPAVCS
jgi:hypothetical protein